MFIPLFLPEFHNFGMKKKNKQTKIRLSHVDSWLSQYGIIRYKPGYLRKEQFNTDSVIYVLLISVDDPIEKISIPWEWYLETFWPLLVWNKGGVNFFFNNFFLKLDLMTIVPWKVDRDMQKQLSFEIFQNHCFYYWKSWLNLKMALWGHNEH